jgi:hypothetical protein
MLKINILPIIAGITRLMSHMERDAPRMPTVLVLKRARNCRLAFHRIPRSVKIAMEGMTARTRNITLIDQKVCHQFNSTSKTWNKRKYCSMKTR